MGIIRNESEKVGSLTTAISDVDDGPAGLARAGVTKQCVPIVPLP